MSRAPILPTIAHRAAGRVKAYVGPEGDHWSIVFPDYTIADMGDTPEQAMENGSKLLGFYLDCCDADGDDPYRPISWRWRMARVLSPRRRVAWVTPVRAASGQHGPADPK